MDIPDYSHLLRYHAGTVALPQGLFEWGYRLSEAALRHAKGDKAKSEALSDQGVFLDRMGFYREASKTFRRAGALDDRPLIWMNLAVADDHDPATNPTVMAETRRRLRRSFGDHPKLPEMSIPAMPDKINIGYVSGDFRHHSAASCSIAMLRHYDKSKFRAHLFSSTPPPGDNITDVYRQIGAADGGYYDLPADDLKAAELIRSKNIHILVDLSGVSGYNRLGMFTRRAAPIQVTAWGYATSTGLPEMDYFLCCETMVPTVEAPYYIEELWRVSRSTHFSFPGSKETWPIPIRRPGQPCFAWLGRIAKVSDDILRVWSEIMRRAPSDCIIRFKDIALDSPMARERVHKIMIGEGVDPNRILMAGQTARHQHIAGYGLADVILDSWPENGGVTTMEALMSGVPLVSMIGPTPGSRGGKLTLTAAGLGHFVARDAKDYVEIALDHMAHRAGHDRRALRDTVTGGVLGNDKAYVAEIEQAYIGMMEARIAGKPPNWIEKQHKVGLTAAAS